VREKLVRASAFAIMFSLIISSTAISQAPGGAGIPGHGAIGGELQNIEKQTWHVFGKVTDLSGEPVRNASVHVDIGYGSKYLKDLTTGLQGDFRTEFTMDTSTGSGMSVKLTADREGFYTARETVDFGTGGKTWEIDIAMRPDTGNADDLDPKVLTKTLAPAMRAVLQNDSSISSTRKDFQRGAEYLLDESDPAKAVLSFGKVVKRYPDCVNCHILLGLAMLDSGSWNSATRELGEAAKLASASGSNTEKATSLLLIAEEENWKGEYAKAAGFLMQAKDLDPKNAFVLQELGRTLMLQKNWEAAEDYLAKASAAGASRDALLLQTRVLLEEGDPDAANAAMNQYVGSENIQSCPVRVRTLYSEVQERMKLHAYSQVKSFVSEPLPSLMQSAPELKGLEPASSQADLAMILQKTGDAVQAFFDNFQNTVSTEQIREERLGKDGKIKDSLDQKFRYLLVTHPQKQRLGLEEFRTNLQGDRTEPTGLSDGLMLSSGFATTSLLFHPAYQSGCAFRYLGRQDSSGHGAYVVAFAQLPDKAKMIERFSTAADSVLILFQGLAWIDAENYKIIRLRTDLLQPQSKIRLQRQTTEISYDPVQFKQVASAMWLPSQVAVTVQWQGKTYRNMHKYSDFKLFNTDVKDKVRPADVPPETTPPGHP